MQLAIEYASLRKEVWAWYWRSWLQRLWKFHALIFACVVVTASLVMFDGPPPNKFSVLVALVSVGLVPLIFLILYPMIRFKPERRSLIVDDNGFETSIGKRHAKLAWSEVSEVIDDDETIVFQGRNGNAMIIPRRAFGSPSERDDFLSFVRNSIGSHGS